MKKLLILSGKGGTGKTTAAAAFIEFSKANVMADCDVDAPNLHIVSKFSEAPLKSDFYGGDKAKIDAKKCIKCGKCADYCKFHAVKFEGGKYFVEEYSCEGCGVCEYVCPAGAVETHPDVAGEKELFSGERIFSTAKLKTGRGNSGKLVTEVKKAMIKNSPKTAKLAVIDGSPGIGCPVIASVAGVDLVLVVAEPSLSGMGDLERILKTASILRAKTAVCVNKYDVSTKKTEEIEKYCRRENIPFLGKIPYDKTVSFAVNSGKSAAAYDCPARTALGEIFEKLLGIMEISL